MNPTALKYNAVETETKKPRIFLGFFVVDQSVSTSASHAAADASEGILQSPLGESVTDPTLGPSGEQERLNCCAKKRRRKVLSHFSIVSLS